MTKVELIKAIAEHGELSRADAEIALLAVQHSITEALAKGERVTLPASEPPQDFSDGCTYRPQSANRRTGRHPGQTQSEVCPE